MLLQYAVFDQSYEVHHPDGSTYWTWKSKELSDSQLQSLYQNIKDQVPKRCNEIAEEDFYGGVIRFGPATAFYRIFNGGKDRISRPDRFILMTAWAATQETLGVNAFDIFESSGFRHTEQQAKENLVQWSSVSEPPELSENVTVARIQVEEVHKTEYYQRLVADNKLSLKIDTIEPIGNLWAALPENRIGSMAVVKTAAGVSAEFVLQPLPAPPPEKTKEQLIAEEIELLVQKLPLDMRRAVLTRLVPRVPVSVTVVTKPGIFSSTSHLEITNRFSKPLLISVYLYKKGVYQVLKTNMPLEPDNPVMLSFSKHSIYRGDRVLIEQKNFADFYFDVQ